MEINLVTFMACSLVLIRIGKVMPGWRRAIELSLGKSDVERECAVAQWRTEKRAGSSPDSIGLLGRAVVSCSLLAAADFFNRDPVVQTWNYGLDGGSRI